MTERAIGWDIGGSDRSAFAIAERQPDGSILMKEIGVIDLNITFESLPCAAWSAPPRELTGGKITAHFTVAPGWIERFQNAQSNRFVAMARPHMPKRMFQRMRGRLKAQRRADRLAAAAAKARPDLNALWYETKVNLALRGLPVGADHGEIGAVVARLAPGWDYVDATRMGDPCPRVALGMYDPRSPL